MWFLEIYLINLVQWRFSYCEIVTWIITKSYQGRDVPKYKQQISFEWTLIDPHTITVRTNTVVIQNISMHQAWSIVVMNIFSFTFCLTHVRDTSQDLETNQIARKWIETNQIACKWIETNRIACKWLNRNIRRTNVRTHVFPRYHIFFLTCTTTRFLN